MTINDLHLGLEPLAPVKPRRKRAAKIPPPSHSAIVNSIESRLALYGCVVQANPNEEASRYAGRARRIANTIPGFPDLTIVCPAGRVAFLEVKSLRDSRSKNRAHWQRQEDTRATLTRMGHLVAVVTDQDQAVETLRGWGVIR